MQLAESLPHNAQVLDIGAGASPFGKEVATLRPDLTWVNYDYSYHNPAILDEVSKNAPPNVLYVPGDATMLTDVYKSNSFDAVFSYWLLAHLSIDHTEPAKAVARAVFKVAKPGGLMSVGPKASQKKMPSLKSGKAIQVLKDESLDANSYAERIVNETKLPKTDRYIQKALNEVATPFFCTTRYVRREWRIPRVYDPESRVYISPFSYRAVKLAGRLAVSGVIYMVRTRNSNWTKKGV